MRPELVGEANLPHNIPLQLWLLLWGYLAVLIVTVIKSYFGGFRDTWREEKAAQHPLRQDTGLCSVEMGQMLLWRGEMNHGADSIVLLWVVVPALNTSLMNPLGFDILFAYHAAWLGIRLAFLGPLSVAALSVLLEPRMWLTIGLVFTSWDFASWQSRTAFFLLPLYGIWVNNCQYPQAVFGVQSRCAISSTDWSFEKYKQAMSRIHNTVARTRCQWLWSRLPTYLERERIIVLLVARVRQRLHLEGASESFPRSASSRRAWNRRYCSVLVPAFAAAPLVYLVIYMRTTRQNWHVDRDQCLAFTGGLCTVLGCPSFRNAFCNRTEWHYFGQCICEQGQCAVDGMCIPAPEEAGMPVAVSRRPAERKRALVFSGGGAKGAYEIGVLKALCEQNSSAQAAFPNWTMLVGTSIGAMNAGFLAQFPTTEQCTHGLNSALRYWQAIINQRDVFESPTSFHFEDYEHVDCLRLSEAPTFFTTFATRGGLCDPGPGAMSFTYEVDPERIRRSGMELWVVATSLNTSQPKWWNQDSKDIIGACLASGALAPLLFPKIINGEWFVDGGFVANTPIMKAIEEGAEEVLVVLLNPLEVPTLGGQQPLGMSILELEFALLVFKYFVETELEHACLVGDKKGVKIWGYAPEHALDSLLDFNNESSARMTEIGYQQARAQPPVDLCQWLHKNTKLPKVPLELLQTLEEGQEPEDGYHTGLVALILAAVVAGVVQGAAACLEPAVGADEELDGAVRDSRRPLLQPRHGRWHCGDERG